MNDELWEGVRKELEAYEMRCKEAAEKRNAALVYIGVAAFFLTCYLLAWG
ncbi:MAG: hypothetical protein ACK4S2_07640 [Gemmobacter sp.]